MKTPPDYGTSFQALKRTTDPDSLHVYYPLFWDVNLLECAIAQHHKRGETREFILFSLFWFLWSDNFVTKYQKKLDNTYGF